MIYLLVLLGAILYTSYFEWVLHKRVMHKPLWGFRYPFKAHAQVHHKLYKADETYHLGDRDWSIAKTITMARWNIFVLLPIAGLPWYILAWILRDPWLAAIPTIVIALYYVTYEYLHWCMHLPKKRRLEKSWAFKALDKHHRLHHLCMNKNFNVVLPLADLMLGTLILHPPERLSRS
ncbi:MAG: hypothetical protein QG585_118 [Patescibacteria group bacterium]|jgi:hypothetical protein|nr:hypothetical protein [Patescibacteria group bacterium]